MAIYKYNVTIRTPNITDAGTDAAVNLTIYGTNGKSFTWKDIDDTTDKDDFEKGDINNFKLTTSTRLGDIDHITLSHNNKGGHAGWAVDYIHIKDMQTNKQYKYDVSRWLAKDEEDGKTEVTLYTDSTNYRIVVFTGEANEGGTDAAVKLIVNGAKGSFTVTDLNDPKDSDDFEMGEVNTVTVTRRDIGEIQSITVSHNNAKNNPSWFLDGITITNEKTNKQWAFPAYQWLATNKGSKKLSVTLTPGKDMVHYDYIGQYPTNREQGWSEELNGVCHDSSNWYFTQNGNIWKFPVTHNLNNSCTKENASKGIYKNSYGHHLGDIDYYKNYLFVPVSDHGEPYIAAFPTSDIHKRAARHTMQLPNGSSYSDLGWLAINPKNGLLFTSNGSINKNNPIYVYSIDIDAIKAGRNDFLKLYTRINLVDEEGDDYVERTCMQGGCFDNDNHLHLCNGFWKNEHSNKKGGITVYEIPELAYKPNSTILVQIRARSNQSHDFRFQFNTLGEEPEGITFWNLTGKNAPNISGHLHAIMLDNAGSGKDDFYFKHYKKI